MVVLGYLLVEQDPPLLWLVYLNVVVGMPVLCYFMNPELKKKED